MASADPESNRPRAIKRQLSSGKLLLDDSGWLAPLNKMVWKSPNFMLYVMLAIGTAVYFLVKHGGFSTGSVRAKRTIDAARDVEISVRVLLRARVGSRLHRGPLPRTETNPVESTNAGVQRAFDWLARVPPRTARANRAR